jgi:hypothetical protein
MTTITLSEIKAAQDRVAEMIAAFEAAAAASTQPTMLIVREASIELQAGETYAGLVLDEEGIASHHLILLSGDADDVSWEAAKEWAEKAGGELPTRREQSLLFANCKGKFSSAWHWSSEQYSASDAWCQVFSDGYQNYDNKSAELRARAVRRFAA